MTTSACPTTSCAASRPADRLRSQRILQFVDAGADGVFILYEYELANGGRYRNTEYITVCDGQIVETQVYFGGRM